MVKKSGNLSINFEDIEAFLEKLRSFQEILKSDWKSVLTQWQNLQDCWKDNQYERFEPFFEELCSIYEQCEKEFEEYIDFLKRQGRLNKEIVPTTIQKPSLDTVYPLKDFPEDIELTRALDAAATLFPHMISWGFPPGIALKISEVPTDAWAIRNIVTELKKVGIDFYNLDVSNAKRQLSNVWITTALGDQGELEVLKSLIEEGYDPNEILVKPHLGQDRPDFYIKENSLICDSKAYKNVSSISDLKAVIERYSKHFQGRGEVRLYFPKDTYKNLSDNLRLKLTQNKSDESVKVNIFPMQKTHSELKDSLTFFYQYLSSLKS